MIPRKSAPAKVILLGEHAVVYGRPAIALPLPQVRAYAEYSPGDRPLRILGDDLDSPSMPRSCADAATPDPLATMAELTAESLGARKVTGEIRLRSQIPIASGMGSGAAVSAALGRATAALLDQDLPDDKLNELVFEIEKLHHGTPSGIDNSVVVHERVVYYQKMTETDAVLQFLNALSPLQLIVADTGIRASTRETVAHVRQLRRRQPTQTNDILRQIGQIAESGRACLLEGDHAELGKLMTRNHALLRQLCVSSPALERLVETAISAGALGAKLSGGGRGGIIIALVEAGSSSALESALWAAQAKRVFQCKLAGGGAGA